MNPRNPFGFNPASVGYPAKVWECFRRNRAFLDDVEKTRSEWNRAGGTLPERPHFLQSGNSLSGHIGHRLLIGYRRSARERFHRVSNEHEWTRLPTGFREEIARLLECETPRMVNVPEQGPGSNPRRIREQWSANLWCLASKGRLLAIPETIRDSEHRRAVLAEIDRLIPSTPPKSGRKFHGPGSVLGTQAEWDAFLVYRHFLPTLEPLDAKQMASWFSFGEDFLSWNERDRMTALGLRRARSIHSKQSTHTTLRIKAVEKAIASVYPAFAPMGDRVAGAWPGGFLSEGKRSG